MQQRGRRRDAGRHVARSVRELALRHGHVVLVVGLAVALFTRFGSHGSLSRDEAIYVYGGQQLAHGVPPYASIFDPKTPLATIISGVAVVGARLLGGLDHVVTVRAVFLLLSCLTVLAVCLLAQQLWRSRLAGVTAGVLYASYLGFARDAFSGPDAKTPAVLLAATCMLLLLRRRYFWAGVVGSLTALAWQPMAPYAAVAVLVAAADPGGSSRRRPWVSAVTGVLATGLVTLAAFLATGGLRLMVEAAVVHPLTGVARPDWILAEHLARVGEVVQRYYGVSGYLMGVGMVVLVVLAVRRLLDLRRTGDALPSQLRRIVGDPLTGVVLLTMVVQVGYVLVDFQGYPDVYPLLVYGALGVGALAPVVARWRLGVPALLLALVVLVVQAGVTFQVRGQQDDGLRTGRVNACALEQLLPRRGGLYVLGDPAVLVHTQRTNPDRFVYLSAGVDAWKVDRTPGGFDGWTEQIREADPDVVVTSGWGEIYSRDMEEWLVDAGYRRAWLGNWRVYVSDRAYAKARRAGIALAFSYQAARATGPGGQELESCR